MKLFSRTHSQIIAISFSLLSGSSSFISAQPLSQRAPINNLPNTNTLVAMLEGSALNSPIGALSSSNLFAAAVSIKSSTSALVINTLALPAAVRGSAYTTTLQASGGTAPYTWSVSTGSLPAGLTLSKTGTLSGTPSAVGTFSFYVNVKDKETPGKTQTTHFSITVSAPAPATLTIAAPALAAGQVGTAYSSTLNATGGTPAYTWSLASGSLPAGLTFAASSGAISGRPTASGTFNFTVKVVDAGNPAQSKTATAAITVAPKAVSTLSITSSALVAAQVGSAYSSTFKATGGTPAYTWSIASGSLPAGLTLSAATGSISGTPTASGTFSLTARVSDAGNPIQTQTAATSITVAAKTVPALSITSSSFVAGQVGTAYAASLQATGGTPAYTWSITSGSLPAGLTLAATTGVISGTPGTSGTFNFTATVSDNGSPIQTQSAASSITVAAAASTPSSGNTWFVRPDGGTRYSTNSTSGQCDGKADVPYSGVGTNQHCAFNDVRFLWQDGSYPNGTFPSYGWVGQGGDTYLLRGSIATGVSYRIGWNNKNASIENNIAWGIPGDPYSSGMPAPPSGTASAHTRILGENYLACHSASAKTQLHGGFGVSNVMDMSGASYVDIACLDLTDFSACGRAAQAYGCNTNPGSLDDYAGNGIYWNQKSTHDTVTDVHIHGLAAGGMGGSTGDGVALDYIDILGNASAGWNMDPGNGTTGTGSLTVKHFNISWNGCAEQYPIVNALPYADCTDQDSGGYGDGFGTSTVLGTTPWNVSFDQGVVSYNTQDGLDALHLIGPGSSMTITRVMAFGNMGNQLKVGGAHGVLENNIVVGNCRAMSQAIPGTPAGYNSRLGLFCRAMGSPVVATVGRGVTTTVVNNTVQSYTGTSIEIPCDSTAGACDATALIDYRNNTVIGYPNSPANGNPTGDGQLPNVIYTEVVPNPITNPASTVSHNLTFNSRYGCTNLAPNDVCGIDPLLADETWHQFGHGDVTPTSVSNAVLGRGTTVAGVTTDYAGTVRATPPAIGAMEK